MATGSLRRGAQLKHPPRDPGGADPRQRGHPAGEVRARGRCSACSWPWPVWSAWAWPPGHRGAGPAVFLPAPGQGALAVEGRDDADGGSLAPLDDPATRARVRGRARLLAELEAGCQVPVGALAALRGDVVLLDGLIASLDGPTVPGTGPRPPRGGGGGGPAAGRGPPGSGRPGDPGGDPPDRRAMNPARGLGHPPGPGNAATAGALRDAGYPVLDIPVLRDPGPPPWPARTWPDWILFVSANAVATGGGGGAARVPAGDRARVRVAAVGRKTAEAARAGVAGGPGAGAGERGGSSGGRCPRTVWQGSAVWIPAGNREGPPRGTSRRRSGRGGPGVGAPGLPDRGARLNAEELARLKGPRPRGGGGPQPVGRGGGLGPARSPAALDAGEPGAGRGSVASGRRRPPPARWARPGSTRPPRPRTGGSWTCWPRCPICSGKERR